MGTDDQIPMALDSTESSYDDSLINYTLSLSPEERLNAHENARRLMNDLKEAGSKLYAKQSEHTA